MSIDPRIRTLKPLVRYLTGESERREQEEVRARLAVDEDAARTYEVLDRIWTAAAPPRQHLDLDDAWQALLQKRQRAQASDAAGRRGALRPVRAGERAGRRRTRTAAAARIAAVLGGLGAVAALTFVLVRPAPAPAPEARVYETARGQRATIQLTDGTHVHLNVESRLTVPSNFAEDGRDVHMQGEAFFEVAHDPERPFTVHTGAAEVRVLGTAFDVRAYAGEAVQVVVAEGAVAFGPAPDAAVDPAAVDTFVLRPGDLGRLDLGALALRRERVDGRPHMAWRDGRLVFVDAPFHVVVRELERWYDLDVEVEVAPAAVEPLRASFGDEPLSEILNAIAAALDLTYDRDRRRITFRPADVLTTATR